MIKKILLLIVAGLAVVTTVVYAAPSVNIFRNIHPETDSTYYNGTTTKAWLGVVSDEFCLTGDSCINQWPAGSGGGASTTIAGLSPSNGVFVFATGTAQGIGLTISTTSPRTITFTPTVSSGYVIPLSASTTEWATAYTWGNHAGLYPTFAYASTTFPSFSYGTSTYATIASYPTYTYASNTFATLLNTPSYTYGSTTYVSFGYATNTFATILNYPTYTYGSSTYISFGYGSSTFPSFSYASSTFAQAANFSGQANYVARWTGTNTLGTGVLYDTGTNVGIGTTSANALLTVYSSGTALQNWYANGGALIGQLSGGNNDFNLVPSGNFRVGTFDSATFNVLTNGNVGIGTSSPVSRLDLGSNLTTGSHFKAGTFEIQGYATNNGSFMDNVYWNGGWKYRNNGYGGAVTFLNGDILFRTAPSGTAGAAATVSDLVTVKNTGNVGIGTSSPSSRLFIQNAAGATDIFRLASSTGITLAAFDASGNLKIPHLIGFTSTPTIATSTGAGASATSTIAGTDLSGLIQVNTFSADTPGANADIVTITFNKAYGSAPYCTLTPANDATWNLTYGVWRYRQSDTTTTIFKIRSGSTPLPATTNAVYAWTYTCTQ